MDNKLIEKYEKNASEIAKVENDISQQIQDFRVKLAELQNKDTLLKEEIKEAMESHDVKKFENEFVSITYVAPSKRVSFDSKKFKDENPEQYAKYERTSEVRSSLRIKVKA